jgi:putative ABC transport system permease protein
MSWTFFDIARRNLQRNLFRSMLAVIGIVIGVLAISSLGILGTSLTLSVTEQLSTVGDSLTVIPIRAPERSSGAAPRPRRSRTGRSRICGGSRHRTR